MGASKIYLQTDSRLVANQVREEFVSKENSMVTYVTEAREALGRLREWKITAVEREDNGEADALAKLGASPGRSEERWMRVENQECPTRNEGASHGTYGVIITEDWRTLIKRFLESGESPTDPMESRRLRNLAA